MNSIDDVRLVFDANGLRVLNGALALIMFGVSLDLSVRDFVRLARDPRAPFVGLFCQFLLLPAGAYLIARAVAPGPSIMLGLILVAACPGGTISNAMTQLAGGRLSVSVGMTAVSTVAAMVTTPFNLAFWGSMHPETARLVESVALDPLQVAGTVAVVLALPCASGMAVAHFRPQWASRLRRPMRYLSVIFFVAVVIGAFAANVQPFLQVIRLVAGPVALLNAFALGLGWLAATVARLSEEDRRAVTIEVGIQNSGLGLVLIFTFFNGLGGMAAIAGWWGIWHIIAGLTLAGFWSYRDRRGKHV